MYLGVEKLCSHTLFFSNLKQTIQLICLVSVFFIFFVLLKLCFISKEIWTNKWYQTINFAHRQNFSGKSKLTRELINRTLTRSWAFSLVLCTGMNKSYWKIIFRRKKINIEIYCLRTGECKNIFPSEKVKCPFFQRERIEKTRENNKVSHN